jgi:hypothetical protein
MFSTDPSVAAGIPIKLSKMFSALRASCNGGFAQLRDHCGEILQLHVGDRSVLRRTRPPKASTRANVPNDPLTPLFLRFLRSSARATARA